MENQEILILAVVGMPATGKSEVIKKLKGEFNFFHLYYGDITFDEIKKRGLKINEVNERLVREEFRSTGDMGIYSKFILPKIQQAIKNGEKRILLESMYNVFEYEIIKQVYPENFKVLAIHTDEEIRIARINKRKERPYTREELKSRQIAEAKNLGKGTVISLADFHHTNNGDDMSVFSEDLEILFEKKLSIRKENLRKDFDSWNYAKKITENKKHISVREGEVFWIKMGLNVGFEEDGKGKQSLRPVVVIKKFSKEIVLGIPLTTQNKTGSWYFSFNFDNILQNAILSQVKTFDTKRFDTKIGTVDSKILKDLKSKLGVLIL